MPDPNQVALYIHWPWCKHKCPYCDFNSHASAPQEEAYVRALLSELAFWKEQLPQRPNIVSIYFGGGTPSLMNVASFEKILRACSEFGHISPSTEISVECNPTSTAKTFLTDIRALGVNRASIGVQGLQETWISFLGRQHTAAEALYTLETALGIFPNVNADVIYGLPQQSLIEWEKQLVHLSNIGLQHISAYQLTIEPQTRFWKDVHQGLWIPIDSDLEADFFENTQYILQGAGYENYEISNFAKPGYACTHNMHVWEYGSYLGIGAGAHGRPLINAHTRLATVVVRQPEAYLTRIETPKGVFVEHTPLSEAQTLQEALFLGLRTKKGIPLQLLQKHAQSPVYKVAISVAEYEYVISCGLLEETEGYLRLTTAGWPLLNSILKRLLPPLAS